MKKFVWASKPAQLFVAAMLLSFSTAGVTGTKVAFTGDQGTKDNARAVLALIANEGTDLLMIQGDLGYDPKTAYRWDQNITVALGADFPVLSVVGNHENHEWNLYHRLIKDRLDRASRLSCSGNPGVKAHCKFANLEIIQVSPGIREVGGVEPKDGYADYISDKFTGSSNKWRICSWHKNQGALQAGRKSNQTGWDVYRSCLNTGAFVAVAHEHSYSRTHLLSDFENQTVVHKDNDMTIEPGRSFMFVSGLGGRSVREQTRGGDWWASIYTASQGATHGALFCDFEQTSAECYFKAIDGSVPDQFTIRLKGNGEAVASNAEEIAPPPPPQPASVVASVSVSLPAVFRRTDSGEIRWVDRDVNGQIGNIWIDKACAETLGGEDISGTWDDLVKLAPGIDSIASPCDLSQVQSAQTQSAADTGYVFRRTDKNEYRWIARNNNGVIGSIQIEESCAKQYGGASESGTWFDLIEVAPAFDQIASPCVDSSSQSASNGSSSSSSSSSGESGYVFARTDKDEMRWIGKTTSGEFGSVRINKNCARNLGGATASGDWQQLLERAPKDEDGLELPCDANDQARVAASSSANVSRSGGYVFQRTDIDEYRWIAQNSSGQMGSTRINHACAKSLGASQEQGDWFRLLEIAPGFDTLPNPCSN